METVDFYPKRFDEIPRQDNPAFDDGECLMVVREVVPKSIRAVVLHINPEPGYAVNHVAIFWQHKDALEYCDTRKQKDDLNGFSDERPLHGCADALGLARGEEES